MSSRGQRRDNSFNPEPRYETGNERSSEFNVDDASDSNIKWTSTPLKKLGPDRLRRRLSIPAAFDSEESTDVRSPTRPLPRRRSAKSLKRIDSYDHRGKKNGKSKRRRSEGHRADDSTQAARIRGGGNYGSGKQRRESNSRSRQDGDSAELSIAELLRKAQETHKNPPQQFRIKYEEPIPLPELTTNTVYVQGRNGFSAVKIGGCRSARTGIERLSKPIDVAIRVHNLSRSVMFFCQGLLGGIALSQVVLVSKVCADSAVLEQINGINYSRVISALFLLLNTVCLLSAMDRIDLARLDLEHLREITCHRCMLLLTLPLYLAAICIHLTVINGDEELICSGREPQESQKIADGNFAQREIHVWKFSLCIAAWICVALGPTDDMTTTHLEAMQKYAA